MRSHGLPLRSRWSGDEDLPVWKVPPTRGEAALEVSQPFHIKLNPGMFHGPRCNHDLGVLLRFIAELTLGYIYNEGASSLRVQARVNA